MVLLLPVFLTMARSLDVGLPLPHRASWELDPQGQGKNLGAGECAAPRYPYYLYPDGITPFFLECMRAPKNN